jgi:hypothetical protein
MTVVIQFLLVASLVLLATMPLVPSALLFVAIRKRGPWGRVLKALAFVVGSCGSGGLAWSSVPSEWTLAFWTTVQAAVNADKYGHPIEHTAENILVFVTFACVAGGALSAGITAGSLKLWFTAKPVSPTGRTELVSANKNRQLGSTQQLLP